MRHRLLLLSILLLLSAVIAPSAAAQLSPGLVSVDTAIVEPGGEFAIPIHLTDNQLDLAGLMVPLRYSSSLLYIDSISYVGSFINDDYFGSFYVDSLDRFFQTTVLPKVLLEVPIPMPTPNGLIATIYGRVSQDASPGVYAIDSINQDDPIWRKVHTTDASGNYSFLPDFRAGAVVVQASTGVDDLETSLPTSFDLAQNYPNPFNPSTRINFSLPRAGHVKMQVFNILGQEVKVLVDKSMPAGNYDVEYNASEQPSGIYFYRLTHSEGVQTKKMILVK